MFADKGNPIPGFYHRISGTAFGCFHGYIAGHYITFCSFECFYYFLLAVSVHTLQGKTAGSGGKDKPAEYCQTTFNRRTEYEWNKIA